ncbi:MAG: ribonuclease J, partial [Halovenus sp.]
MLQALQPQHVIPAHQDMSGYADYVNLAEENGYSVGRDLHVTRNGNMVQLVE